MMNKNKMNMNELIKGTIFGSIVGFSVAMLFAPKQGSELRRDISEKSKVALEKADDWKDTIQEKSSEYSDMAMAKGSDLIDKGDELGQKVTQDRKSTRLNSSHVSI